MIIGISGNNKAGKLEISKYLEENYSFKYVDVDQILEDVLKELILKDENVKNNWKNNTALVLKIRNEIDERINLILESLNEDETIVLDYSLLEDSYVFEKCDLLIKSSSNNKEFAISDVDFIKKHRAGAKSSEYMNSMYHLNINLDEDWENK